MDTRTILALHRNPGHAIPWYLLLRDDVEGHEGEVVTVGIRRGNRGRFRDPGAVAVPDYMVEVFDFTNYESLAELDECFSSPMRRYRGAAVLKVTEPEYR